MESSRALRVGLKATVIYGFAAFDASSVMVLQTGMAGTIDDLCTGAKLALNEYVQHVQRPNRTTVTRRALPDREFSNLLHCSSTAP